MSRAADDTLSLAEIRQLLRGATCASCEQGLDERCHRAVLVDRHGAHLHLVCSNCWAGDHREVARRVQLNLLPTAGAS